MTLQSLFASLAPSIVRITTKSGATGTGFMIGAYLVTNNHNLKAARHNASIMHRLETYDAQNQSLQQWSCSGQELLDQFEVGSPENDHDYAVIKLERTPFTPGPLPLASVDVRVGDDVFFPGFHFEHPRLVLHTGHISSIYPSGVATVLQLDASVNHGVSGAPLVHLASGSIVGIVSRKGTGLTEKIEELQKFIDFNIRSFPGILETRTQNHMQGMPQHDPHNEPSNFTLMELAGLYTKMSDLLQELRRSANVGIGYALCIKALKDEPLWD
ncbi:S1 family peptidase [Deinococcus cellulosilyticus]|uniref:Serine protease n=1 Tax=Deinococcus cellulosilyticus (strain DSM 18568 / NBRC 106333 / KACC 11606 / 5516J-15) TaxID=1223518 RepID=A0A511NB35_DEIC1|nr:serine protease [Deinococcus cellulosilyticus]GEM49776.1 hypothetical protein DC3_54110 [Deinococcus cellulosilyticus NBRC 106333 = KACC 11606]